MTPAQQATRSIHEAVAKLIDRQSCTTPATRQISDSRWNDAAANIDQAIAELREAKRYLAKLTKPGKDSRYFAMVSRPAEKTAITEAEARALVVEASINQPGLLDCYENPRDANKPNCVFRIFELQLPAGWTTKNKTSKELLAYAREHIPHGTVFSRG